MKLLSKFIHLVSQLLDEHHRLVRKLIVMRLFMMLFVPLVNFPLQGLCLLMKLFRHLTTSRLSQELSRLMQLCNLVVHLMIFIRLMMHLLKVVFPFWRMPKHLMNLR